MKIWSVFSATSLVLLASPSMSKPESTARAHSTAALNAALCTAAKTGTAVQIKALISKGARPAAMCDQMTVLFVAVLADKLDNIAALIEAGADVNQAGESKYIGPPLFAVKSEQAARLLIDHGADVNARKYDNSTPLIEDGGFRSDSASDESAKIATLLIDHGARPNDADDNGFTALMQAVATNGMQSLVATLLGRGADPNLRASNGNTALDIAINGEHDATTLNESTKDFRDYEDAIRAHGGVQ